MFELTAHLDPNVKRCEVCDGLKPLGQYGKRKRAPDGRNNVCKLCVKAANNRASRDPATIRKRRDARLRRVYGITLAEYERMGRAQRWRCPICKRLATAGERLVVDHDHASGAVRRLLCRAENAALGALGDSPARLDTAAYYLRSHPHAGE
jgi:hypothetical protein